MGRDLSGLDIGVIKGVGTKKAEQLRKLGLYTVRDALFYLPLRYEDRRTITPIAELEPDASYTVSAIVQESRLKQVRGRGSKPMQLLEVSLKDDSGIVVAKWFNQPYLKTTFKTGVKVLVNGAVKRGYRSPMLEISSPVYEVLGKEGAEPDDNRKAVTIHAGRAVPVYGSTEGMSQKYLRKVIHTALEAYASELDDPMPPKLIEKLGLPPLRQSVLEAHFPSEDADVLALNNWEADCQRRLSFDELFMFEAGMAVIRSGIKKEKGISFKDGGELVNSYIETLPFKLTDAQERALTIIFGDMITPHPMQRLLQGDVGSGKTVVAMVAMLRAVGCGYQAALMAPTEILAEQHYIGIHGIMESLGVKVRLLTGSTKERPYNELEDGTAQIVIGTHALIQESVKFKSLGLVVIDEQHRFGVMQRSILRKKGMNPDVLIMTATPIPRTLSLTLYGDLDYTVIDELPPGRTPVRTETYMPDRKHEAYTAMEEEVAAGGQVYLVYPLIEESEKLGLKNASDGYEGVLKMFPGMRTALIHGRLKPAEKESVMSGFKAGQIDILVCTTVIEVGVDVPNASLMLIVHAERFGLSQLHQLRGRVGRGERKSRCMLLAYPPMSEDGRQRLIAMNATNDGFKIAEQDLSIRGPGEFMGTRQSGMPELKVADILRDAKLLEIAKTEAFALIEGDPALDGYPDLKMTLEGFWRGRVDIFSTG